MNILGFWQNVSARRPWAIDESREHLTGADCADFMVLGFFSCFSLFRYSVYSLSALEGWDYYVLCFAEYPVLGTVPGHGGYPINICQINR